MSYVATILLALHGFHSTPKQCNSIAVALADLAVDSSINKYDKMQTNLDADLLMIRRFRRSCARPK